MWNMYARTHNKTRGARRGTQSIVSRSFRFIHAAAGHMQPVAAHIHMPVAISDLPFFHLRELAAAPRASGSARSRSSSALWPLVPRVELCLPCLGPFVRGLGACALAVRVAFAPTVTHTALAVRADSHTHDTLSLNRPANKCSLYLYAYVLAFLFVKLLKTCR